jgi:predicted ribosome quality control (RQC) complex YloA/Tae2 family protein
MDNAVHNRIYSWLKGSVEGRTIEKVQAAAEGILIQFGGRPLFICLNPELPFLYTMPQHAAAKTRYGYLAGQLHQHLAGHSIQSFVKPLHDRFFFLTVEDRESGDFTLAFQAFPRNVELRLLDGDGEDMIDPEEEPPEEALQTLATEKNDDFYHAPPADVMAALAAECDRETPEEAAPLAGLSPELKQIFCRIRDEGEDVAAEAVKTLQRNEFDLRLLEEQRGHDLINKLLPELPGMSPGGERFSDLDSAVPLWFGREARRQEIARVTSEITTALKNQRKRSRRALKKLAREAEDHAGKEDLGKMGDLILANMHTIKRGQEEITVDDLYSETGGNITIPIDPSLPPEKNARRYYDRAAKAKRAHKHLETRERELQVELDQAEAFSAEVDAAGDDLKALRKLRDRLISEGIIIEKKEKKRQKRSKPGRRFKIPGGAQIIVGRNGPDNEAVTFSVGNDLDFWLHAAGMPGSHVILRNPEKRDEPLPRELEFAAALAAYYSKGRNSSNVQVHWTQRRFVKKIKGAPPGKVLLKNYRSTVVDPRKPPTLEVES